MKTYIFGNGNTTAEQMKLYYFDVIDILLKDKNNSFVVCDYKCVGAMVLEYLKDKTSNVTILHMFETLNYIPSMFKTKISNWNIIGGFKSDVERDTFGFNMCDSFIAYSNSFYSETNKNIRLLKESHKHIQRYDSDILNSAFDIAYLAHKKQKRKFGGGSYINHPIAVSNNYYVQKMGEVAIATALLHDVLEDCNDTDITDRILIECGREVYDNVVMLTRKSGQSYDEYKKSILESENAIVLAVKYADSEHNSIKHIDMDERWLKKTDVYVKNTHEYFSKMCVLW